jgi:hypothetical protein
MLSNLKLIFIHGVNDQSTNYSQHLFENLLTACRDKLKSRNLDDSLIDQILSKVVRHEVMWADLTVALTARYDQLQYPKRKFLWDFTTRKIDPLAMQIMQYIKDKGDKQTGPMNILRDVDDDIAKVFLQTNIGEFVQGENKNAIIIAHSLGSVIAFDYVFCFRDKCRLDPSITIKAFITMGSPIPLFTSAMGHPDSDLTLPHNVRKWVNIMSRNDGIARKIQPFFKNIPIKEHEIFTSFLPIKSHCDYWKSKRIASVIADEVLEALDPRSEAVRPHLVEAKLK